MVTRTAPRERGFTLVELLVAVGLAIIILGLAIYVVNSATFESYKVTGAGDRLSQYLIQAKNRALRDKAPRGLRLMVTGDPNNVNIARVTECAFIEQPEAWMPPAEVALQFDYNWDTAATPPQFTYKRVFLTVPTTWNATAIQNLRDQFERDANNNGNADDFPNATVKPGDTVYVPDLGYPFRIVLMRDVIPGGTIPDGAVIEFFLDNPVTNAGGPGTPPTGYMLSHRDMLPDLGAAHGRTPSGSRQAAYRNGQFGIYRQAQVILGEPTVQLHAGMAVDLDLFPAPGPGGPLSYPWRNSLNIVPSGGVVDIVFAPSGEVVGATSGVSVLLLRNVQKVPGSLDIRDPANFDTAGEMILVAIYTKTGAIATQRPARDAADPHRFVKDAINTGL